MLGRVNQRNYNLRGMNWQEIRTRFPWMTNRYFLSGFAFAIWMGFFDSNSILMQIELSQEIEKLENGIDFYSHSLEIDKEKLHQLQSDPEQLEKFAREEYWLCKEGEEVFLIAESVE